MYIFFQVIVQDMERRCEKEQIRVARAPREQNRRGHKQSRQSSGQRQRHHTSID